MNTLEKIGLGGGCHWCTEAVFLSLRGVHQVQSGWIRSVGEHCGESESVIVHFNPDQISLKTLIEIHVLTHSSASNHSMRDKYRSAIYVFSKAQAKTACTILEAISEHLGANFVTIILDFAGFRAVQNSYKNYYYSDRERPFCVNIIEPKLQKIIATHREHIDQDRLVAK